MSLAHDAYRYAIRNAFSHHGKADMAAVIGKLKALYPKTNVKELVPVAKEAVGKVNALGMDEIRSTYEEFSTEGFELKIPEKKVGLLNLDWAVNEPVVTRFAPNPSAPAHLGHLRAAILSYLYAQKYSGKFILRFDDTDPKLKKPMEGGEQIYLEDLHWLGMVPAMVARSSDRLDIYYDYMSQLVAMGKAYVCTCESSTWKKNMVKQKACACREMDENEQKKRLEKFLKHEYKQGEALLRVKTDVHADDPAERDWWAARLVDQPQHYRVKGKHVWPSYNFASAIDDHLMGVTLIIRGQQHASNVKKQEWLYQHFGWKYPHAFHHGQLLVNDTELSKSKIMEGIQMGKYTGYDDPRLYTVQSLRRKGFAPQALIDLMIDLGVKTSNTTADLQLLGTFNKPYVEKAPAFTLIQDPIALDVDFGPELDVNMEGQLVHLKPGTQGFVVSKHDAHTWKVGTTIRLRNAYIAKINSMDEYKINAQFVSTKKLENTVQTEWLVKGMDVRITMPNSGLSITQLYGIADDALSHMQVNDIVYFPQFGYCRVDEKTPKEIRLWFTHP